MKTDQISLLERHLAYQSNLTMAPRKFGNWVFKSRIHASSRALERCGDVSYDQWEKMIGNIAAFVLKLPMGIRELEYMFISESLQQAMTVAVDFPNKEMRIFTVFDPGIPYAKPNTVVAYVD